MNLKQINKSKTTIKKGMTLYILFIAAVFIFLKFMYKYADNQDLNFILIPVDFIISAFTGVKSSYIVGTGYFFKELNMVINKSCSGFNFLVLNFMLLSYLSAKYINNIKVRFSIIPLLLFISYIFTVFVNASRILGSIVIHPNPVLSKSFKIIHEAEGVFIYLTFLILLYISSDYFFKYLTHKAINGNQKFEAFNLNNSA